MTNKIIGETRCVCCGIEVPVDDPRVPADVAEYIRKLRKEAQPILAVTELKRLTGMSLGDAKYWADHCGEPIGRAVQTGPCPFCGKELRTDTAKQCRHCKRDWHDENNLLLLGTNQLWSTEDTILADLP